MPRTTFVEVDDGWLERLFPGEGEQAVGQFAAAPRRPEGIVGEFASLGIAAHALSQELQIADHDGKQIIEIMRDAAGELAQRLHLLRLAQLLRCSSICFDEVGDLLSLLDRGDRGKLPSGVSLGEIADPAALRFLLPCRDDPDPDVRKLARWAISQCDASGRRPR